MQNTWNPSYLPAPSSSVPFYAKPSTLKSFQAASEQEPVPAVDALPRDISMRFGERLRDLRKARNMTQLRMAVDFGIDRSFISDVECGKKSISLTLLEVIALGMEIQLSDLLSGL